MARRASTASRCSRSFGSTRSIGGFPVTTRRAGARHRGRVLNRARRPPGGLALPAERQPRRHREIPYKLRWMARLEAWAASAWNSRSRSCSPATTTSSPCPSTPAARCLVWATRSSSPNRGGFPAPRRARFHRRHARRHRREGRLHLLDYQAGAWQKNKRHKDRFPDALAGSADRLRSATIDSTSAPGRSLLTTCRW